MKKTNSILGLTQKILQTPQYFEHGKLIVVYNNTEREVFDAVDFFQLIFVGENLELQFSIEGTDEKYDKTVELAYAHNINGVVLSV